MAKKKPHEESDEAPISPSHEAITTPESEPQSKSSTSNGLMDEIQTFMSMRDELAQKLATEIEATERKLEELKATAASLFPQNGKPIDDKKAKKPKPKPVKEDKEPESGAEG